MSVTFDGHVHCFPPLAEDRGIKKRRLAEHQHHVRFHGQGIRRLSDGVRIPEPLLVGEGDGISYLPDVDFRIGPFGRLEFTHGGEDYFIQWMPPVLQDMSCSPELMIAQMDYVGVDRAVLQHDRIYGKLDDFLGDCVRRYPDRFVALAQVDEWVGGRDDQLERLRRQVEDLGHSGLFFSTGGFFQDDFRIGVNDPSLDPLWGLVRELGITIHWYAAKIRQPLAEDYLQELREFITWAEAHPQIPSVLTHGLNNVHYDVGKPGRFSVPEEISTLLKFPGWHMELMLHLMAGDLEFPPYEDGLSELVQSLVEDMGADRLVWGSDMPACERTVTFKQSMVLFRSRCDFLSKEQLDAIMGENLARLYPLRA